MKVHITIIALFIQFTFQFQVLFIVCDQIIHFRYHFQFFHFISILFITNLISWLSAQSQTQGLIADTQK